MQRNWTKVGTEIVGDRQEQIGKIFDSAEWLPLPQTMSMAAGYLVKEAVRQLGLKAVRRVFDTNKLAPFGLVGIENAYKNGLARIYVVDEGCDATIICTDFFPTLDEQETIDSQRRLEGKSNIGEVAT
jgi:hypothetical protein